MTIAKHILKISADIQKFEENTFTQFLDPKEVKEQKLKKQEHAQRRKKFQEEMVLFKEIIAEIESIFQIKGNLTIDEGNDWNKKDEAKCVFTLNKSVSIRVYLSSYGIYYTADSTFFYQGTGFNSQENESSKPAGEWCQSLFQILFNNTDKIVFSSLKLFREPLQEYRDIFNFIHKVTKDLSEVFEVTFKCYTKMAEWKADHVKKQPPSSMFEYTNKVIKFNNGANYIICPAIGDVKWLETVFNACKEAFYYKDI